MTARCAQYVSALKILSVLTTPTAIFPEIFNGLLFGWTLRMHQPNLQSVALAVIEIIAIAVLGGVVNPQSSGRGAVGGRRSGMAPFERAL